jgi:hypothetical protein
MHRKLLACILFSSVLLLALLSYYFKHAYNILNYNHSVKPDLLVAEGWMGEEYLESVKNEFLKNDYQLLITTGFPYTRGWTMGIQGKLVFDTRLVTVQPDSLGGYLINLKARGTKACSQYPHFIILADTLPIGEGYVSREFRSYSFRYTGHQKPENITILYDNDLYTRLRDRNLVIHEISVNDQPIKVANNNAAYFVKSQGAYHFKQYLATNTAELVAKWLIQSGIPSDKIVPIVTQKPWRSRTYSTAKDVAEWIGQRFPTEKRSLTIITEGMHSRRSYYLYKKACDRKCYVGVKFIPDRKVNFYTWWRYRYGWQKVLYESVGLIYALCI